MREQDMRQRVQRFLQARLRNMLAPATLGLGLAMAGCPSSGNDATDDAGALVNQDGAPDQQFAPAYMAQLPKDAGPDQATTKYIAPIPDAGPELPLVQPDYMAPMPDAGPVARYMAVMPDAGREVGQIIALYMAQLPPSQS
jgi:hypothetical protein